MMSSALPASVRKYAGHSAALFVGVRKFDDPDLRPVSFAADDAVDLAHLFVVELGLVDPAKTVLLISGEPQKNESLERLRALEAAAVKRDRPTISTILAHSYRLGQSTGLEGICVVFFATHGFTDQGKGVLAAADTLKRRAVHTGVVLDVVIDDLMRAPAPRRLVLVDACRERLDTSTRTPDAGEPLGDAFIAAMEKARGCAILIGAARGGFSYDDRQRQNGVFTGALLDGLRGAATSSDEGLITIQDLGAFADRQVRDWVVRNRPHHVSASFGISETYDPPAIRGLPLAMDLSKQRGAFGIRRRKALAHLVAQVDTRHQLFKDCERALDVEALTPELLELLAEIEAFDGSPRLRRSLEGLLREANPSLWLPPSRARPPMDKPYWAADAGEDIYGHWADLRLQESVQCLRWFEPEWVKSPDSESSTGFWMGATLCPGEFFTRVMGPLQYHPYPFDGPGVRVQQDDVQQFFKSLNQRFPRLGARLPSGGELDRACRPRLEVAKGAGENRPPAHEVPWPLFYYDAVLKKACMDRRPGQPNAWGISDISKAEEWTQEPRVRPLPPCSFRICAD